MLTLLFMVYLWLAFCAVYVCFVFVLWILHKILGGHTPLFVWFAQW